MRRTALCGCMERPRRRLTVGDAALERVRLVWTSGSSSGCRGAADTERLDASTHELSAPCL